MKEKKISDLIKEMRIKKDMSMDRVVEELSKQGIDITKSSLSRLENGDRQKIDSTLLVGLSNLFNFNFFKCLGLSENLIKTGDVKFRQDESLISIPVMAKVSAGNGYLNFKDEPLYKKSIRKNGFDKQCYLVEVVGDSMEPLIQDGAFVVVDPRQTEYIEGKIYIVKFNEETFIKKIYIKPEIGMTILKSINPKYDDIFISKEELEQVEIKGRAIKFIFEGNL